MYGDVIRLALYVPGGLWKGTTLTNQCESNIAKKNCVNVVCKNPGPMKVTENPEALALHITALFNPKPKPLT